MPHADATTATISSVRTQSQPRLLLVSRDLYRALRQFAPALHHKITPLRPTAPHLRTRLLGFWDF